MMTPWWNKVVDFLIFATSSDILLTPVPAMVVDLFGSYTLSSGSVHVGTIRWNEFAVGVPADQTLGRCSQGRHMEVSKQAIARIALLTNQVL